MNQTFFVIGGVAIVLLAFFTSLVMAFATPVQIPDAPIPKALVHFLRWLIMLSPVWCLTCVVAYFRGWGFEGNARYLWVLLTALPILIGLLAEHLAKLIGP